MIFKGFKVKSNQKYVNKLLEARKVAINTNKIKTFGVILNSEEFHNSDSFQSFFEEINAGIQGHKIVTFINDHEPNQSAWQTQFTSKDFGWRGKIKNVELQTFLDTKFDVLIGYFKKDILELKLATAMSNANFKIGISRADDRLYDLIIDVNPSEFDVFKTELVKYLNILNKL